MPRKPTAIDLFCGAGGLSTGLKQAGFRVIGAVDLEPLAVETYKANHRRTVIWERDVRKLPVVEVRRKLRLKAGQLDLLAGCPPCEGFSSIRTRNGSVRVRDERNDLVLQFIRFVRGLKPRTVMIENVPALASNRRLRRLRAELRRLGYSVDVKVLNVVNYGVPQRRRRMVLLASRFGTVPSAEGSGTLITVRETIGRMPKAGKSGDPLHDLPERRSLKVARLIAAIPKNGGSRSSLGRRRQLECHKKCDGFKDIYGRMTWDAPAPTITGGCVNPSKGRFLHPHNDRTITLREAALLQTFPPDYVISLSRGKFAAADLIGDALPPEFTRQLALKIKEHLEETRRP